MVALGGGGGRWKQWAVGVVAGLWFVGGAGCGVGDEGGRHGGLYEEEVDVTVRVLVVTRGDGTGNELWSPAFVQHVLHEVWMRTDTHLTWDMLAYDTVADDRLYAMSTLELLSWSLSRLREPGMVTVVVCNPETADGAGRATIERTRAALVVMRSRVREHGEEAVQSAAGIFLHELGHQMGFRHSDDPKREGRLTADNYWVTEEGLDEMKRWAKTLE